MASSSAQVRSEVRPEVRVSRPRSNLQNLLPIGIVPVGLGRLGQISTYARKENTLLLHLENTIERS